MFVIDDYNAFFEFTRPIEVKTGDYRGKWVDAHVTCVKAAIHEDEDGNKYIEMEAGFSFIDEDSQTYSQWCYSLAELQDKAWRFKELAQ